MRIISFKANKHEFQLISDIVKRAKKLGLCGFHNYSSMTCNMDITACHANGNELNLQALLNADAFDFTHDVCGICRHINRETGELRDCFSPRFSVREVA